MWGGEEEFPDIVYYLGSVKQLPSLLPLGVLMPLRRFFYKMHVIICFLLRVFNLISTWTPGLERSEGQGGSLHALLKLPL